MPILYANSIDQSCLSQGSLVTRLSPHPDKNRKGGGEPGIDSHVILWHDDITAIIAEAATFYFDS